MSNKSITPKNLQIKQDSCLFVLDIEAVRLRPLKRYKLPAGIDVSGFSVIALCV